MSKAKNEKLNGASKETVEPSLLDAVKKQRDDFQSRLQQVNEEEKQLTSRLQMLKDMRQQLIGAIFALESISAPQQASPEAAVEAVEATKAAPQSEAKAELKQVPKGE